MGGPEKIGYSGGKFEPRENDRVKGIVAAKSLQAFEAICISPPAVVLIVFVIKRKEKKKKIIIRSFSDMVSEENTLLNIYRSIQLVPAQLHCEKHGKGDQNYAKTESHKRNS